MTALRCPGCTETVCICRSTQLGLFDGLDDQPPLVAVVDEDLEHAQGVAAAGDLVSRLPLPGSRPERAQVVAVDVDEAKGGHVWTIRLAGEKPASRAAWDLIGGPCAGYYETSTWPPPETIRAVHGGVDGPAVLDLADDVVEAGETVEVYRLESHGHVCGGRGGCRLVAAYYPLGFTTAQRIAAARELLAAARELLQAAS